MPKTITWLLEQSKHLFVSNDILTTPTMNTHKEEATTTILLSLSKLCAPHRPLVAILNYAPPPTLL